MGAERWVVCSYVAGKSGEKSPDAYVCIRFVLQLYGSRGLEKPETEAYNSRKRIVVEGVLGNGLCRGPATVGAGDQACFVLQPKMWKDQKCR